MANWNPHANDLFLKALDVPEPDRPAFLAAECGDDADLLRSVNALLAAHAAAGGFLAAPHPDAAPTITTPPGDANATRGADDTDTFDPARTRGDGANPAGGTGAGLLADRYKLLEPLGEGGMGTVYRAEQVHPVRRMVAVKLIKAGTDTARVIARFEAERQALAVMDHPNIARVLDGGVTATGQPFFVMELVAGSPITAFADGKKLTIPQRLELFALVCAAVQHAHQKGIIHRDLKPGNVLVTEVDGKPVPKVIDFGLAKALQAGAIPDVSLEATGFGSVLGTPLYMAPEQADPGTADIDTRADVYALGVILYELLTGSTPHTRESFRKAALSEVLRVVREVDPPTPVKRLEASESVAGVAAVRGVEPARLARLVRGDLEWVTMKALAKERDRRYESATALAADVERFLNHEPVTAGPPSRWYRARKFVRRNRAAVTAAAVVFLALVAGVVGTTLGLMEADAQRKYAEGQEKKAKDETAAKETARAAEEAARKGLEVELASREIDQVNTVAEASGSEAVLGRYARLVADLPPHATALRDFLQLRMLILGHGQYYSSHLFAPADRGSNFLVTSPEIVVHRHDGGLDLADPLTRQPRVTLRVPDAKLSYATHSDDNRVLVAVRRDPSTNGTQLVAYFFFDMASGRLLSQTAADVRINGQISTDGRRYLSFRTPSAVADDKMPIEVWDTATGKLVAECRNNVLANFSPDTRWVVAFGSFNGERSPREPVRVYAAEDGRLVATLPPGEDGYLYACVTPSGKYLVTFTCKRVQWHRTSDWQPEGKPSRSLNSDRQVVWRMTGPDTNPGASRAENARPLRRFAFDDYAGFLGTESGEVGGSEGGATGPLEVYLRGQEDAISLNAGLVDRDAEQLILSNGQLVKFHPFRVTSPERGHRVPPEVRALAASGRFLPNPLDGSTTTLDVAADKETHVSLVVSEVRGRRCAVVATGDPFVPGTITNPLCIPLLPGGYDNDLLRLWVGVVCCGEVDDGNVFHPWDEPAWEAKRAELERRIVGRPEEEVFRPAATARLHWAHSRLLRAKTSAELLAVLERLIRTNPRSGYYLARANLLLRMGRFPDALADWREGGRLYRKDRADLQKPLGSLSGVPLHDAPVLDETFEQVVITTPNLPRSDYELAIDVISNAHTEERPHQLREVFDRNGPWQDLRDYRLGKYVEVADRLQKIAAEPIKNLAAQLAVGAHTPLATAVTLPLFFYGVPPDGRVQQVQPSSLTVLQKVMLSMCEFQLGRKDEAKALLLAQDRYVLPHGLDLRNEAKALMGLPVPPPKPKRKL